MKRLILAIATIISVASFTCYAQNKGDMIVGGDLGLSTVQSIYRIDVGDLYYNESVNQGITFTVKPEFGYFLADNLEVDLGLSYTLVGGYGNGTIYNHSIAAELGMHYFVSIIQGRFYYTPGFTMTFGGDWAILKSSNGDRSRINDNIPFIFGVDIELGRFEFKANDHWGFSASMLTLNVSTTSGDKNYARITNVGVNFNCGLTLGTHYYF